jgi:hypothetical protein
MPAFVDIHDVTHVYAGSEDGAPAVAGLHVKVPGVPMPAFVDIRDVTHVYAGSEDGAGGGGRACQGTRSPDARLRRHS